MFLVFSRLPKHIKRGKLLLSRNIIILQLINNLLKIERLVTNKNEWWLGPVRYAEKTLNRSFLDKINTISLKATEKDLNEDLATCLDIFVNLLHGRIKDKHPKLAEKYKPQLNKISRYINKELDLRKSPIR